MDDAPLVTAPVHGLRSWTVVGAGDARRLGGPHQEAEWPPAGGWLSAKCHVDPSHAAPVAGCDCGIHAWHPSRRAARDVLAVPGRVPGIMEAQGRVELHADGLRAERARPYALVLGPRGDPAVVRALAAMHRVQVVEVSGAAELEAWCRERGIGLEPAAVEGMLGPEVLARRRRARTLGALRVAAGLLLVTAVAALGFALAAEPESGSTLRGRAGEVTVP